jgi:predicted DNA binding protein
VSDGGVIEAHLVIRHHGCVVSECLTEGAQAAQISADREADILVMQGERAEQVDAFLRNLAATQAKPPQIVHRTDTSVVVRGRNPEWGLVATILRSGASILWPAVWRDGLERYTVVVSSRDALAQLVERLEALGDVKVEKLSEVGADALAVSVPLADLTHGFTAKQLAAIQLAISEGYYETPRRTSAEDLAAKMGLSRSTYEEHLRKAERRALERFAAAVSAHDVLAKAANRKPGRPRKDGGR